MPNPLQKLRHRYAAWRNNIHDHELATPILIALVAVLVILILWLLPHYQVRHTPGVTGEKLFDSENEARKTLAQIFGGAVVLLGLYYSARTFGLSREGHITDRFTKAIEQLGKTDGDKPNIEVRLGAIYALERIAIDSERDHWTIMEVLTAYVRQNAPLDPGRPYTEGEKPRTDIQAILTVLGRRRTGPRRERSNQKLNLSESRLCGANIYQANYRDANLYQANLQRAIVFQTNLQGTNLVSADLQKASFRAAILQNAHLSRTNLQEAFLGQADLQGAFLREANLQKTFLREANLQGADIEKANLLKANLRAANLKEARLGAANLKEAAGMTTEQVKSAISWEDAHYSPAFRAELGLPPEPAEEQAATTLSS